MPAKKTTEALKVCFVSHAHSLGALLEGDPHAHTGGAELTLILMGRAMARQGVDVTFVVSRPGRKDSWVTDGMKVLPSIAPPVGSKLTRVFAPLISMLRSMRSVDADVYYSWAPSRNTAIAGLYCLLKGVPFIFGIMHDWDVDGTFENRLGFIDRKLFHFVLQHAAGAYAQTNHQLDLLRQHLGREGELIRNFSPMSADANAETKRDVVLWVGSFNSVKRPEWFAELARRLPEHKFVMIGGAVAQQPEVYERVAGLARDIPNLTLAGKMSFEGASEQYKHALVHVLTSTTEGFPNVLLEAWRSGAPSVSTFDPDGLITTHGLGYFCRDIDELTDRLKFLLNDHKARVEMGKRAIEYVRENHDPDKIAGRVIKLFEGLLRRSTGRKAADDPVPLTRE